MDSSNAVSKCGVMMFCNTDDPPDIDRPEQRRQTMVLVAMIVVLVTITMMFKELIWNPFGVSNRNQVCVIFCAQ
jgi:hypothetical protein